MVKTLRKKESRFILETSTGKTIHKNEAKVNEYLKTNTLNPIKLSTAIQNDTALQDKLKDLYFKRVPSVKEIENELKELMKDTRPETTIRIVFLKEIIKKLKNAKSKNIKLRPSKKDNKLN